MSFDPPKSRNEAILQNMLGANNALDPPNSRVEELLMQLLEQGGGATPEQIAAAVADYLDEHGVSITADSALSGTSENPVQNKVIKNALDTKGTYSKPSGGIPKTDLAPPYQIRLFWNSSLQEFYVDKTLFPAVDIISNADNSELLVEDSVLKLARIDHDGPDEVVLYFVAGNDGGSNGFIVHAISRTDPDTIIVTRVDDTSLPIVSSSNNGAFLRVVNGAWAAATVPSAESNSFGGGS